MARSFIVYALVDPRTQQWRYIGKANDNGMARYRSHMSHARKGDVTYVYSWIRSLLALGMAPSMEIVEKLSDEQAALSAEVEWIAEARRSGVPLTNITDGGDGGGHQWTAERHSQWRSEGRARRLAKEAHDQQTAHVILARIDAKERKAATPRVKAVRSDETKRRQSISAQKRWGNSNEKKAQSARQRARFSKREEREAASKRTSAFINNNPAVRLAHSDRVRRMWESIDGRDKFMSGRQKAAA